jgi:hypothetical protein
MTDSFGLPVEGMTLANVSGGQLEQQFQECLENAVAIFNEDDKYELDKHDTLHVRIRCDIVLSLNMEADAASVSARAGLIPPRRKGATRAAYVKSGAVLVDTAQQMPLGVSNVSKIKPEK